MKGAPGRLTLTCWARIVSPFGLSEPAKMQLRVYGTGVAATLRSSSTLKACSTRTSRIHEFWNRSTQKIEAPFNRCLRSQQQQDGFDRSLRRSTGYLTIRL